MPREGGSLSDPQNRQLTSSTALLKKQYKQIPPLTTKVLWGKLYSEAIPRQLRELKQVVTAKCNILPRDEPAGLSNCQHALGELCLSSAVS